MTTAPAPETTIAHPGDLLRIGTAFCSAKILLTALELRLFTLLHEGPATEPEIREKLGLHPRGSRDFLDALVAFGVLLKDDGLYRNSPAADRYLVPGELTYAGGFLERANQMLYPAWGRFTEALLTGEPQVNADSGEPYDAMSADPDQLRSFLGMMDTMNSPLGPALAEVFPWSRYGSMVDVGGARGNLAAAVATRHPRLSAGVFDLPQVEPFFTEHMAGLGLSERLTFHAGDFFKDPLPAADVLIIGHVLHDWNPDVRRMLLRKAYAAVRPGGAVLVYDPMLDPERPNPVNLVISLDMLLTTRGGGEYSPAECRGWLEECGFRVDPPKSLGFSDTLLVGHKDG